MTRLRSQHIMCNRCAGLLHGGRLFELQLLSDISDYRIVQSNRYQNNQRLISSAVVSIGHLATVNS